MTILSVSDLRLLQDVSVHKDDAPIESSIEATEREFVKKYVGDAFFVFILEQLNVSPVNSFITLLLEGGFYEDACSPAKKFYINGLNKAIALLTYCDLILKPTIVTRYGAKNKDNEGSKTPDKDDALIQINRYRNTALSYLKDIDFMLINIDVSDFNSDTQEALQAYRDLNNNSVKEFFEAF